MPVNVIVSDFIPAREAIDADVVTDAGIFPTDAGSLLFFFGTSGLWRSDGTPEGTFEIFSLNDPENVTDFQFLAFDELTGIDGNLFFVATEGENEEELYISNGTPEGTGLLKDINPDGSSEPRNLVDVDSNLFFTADSDGNDSNELWVSDGTTEGTQLVLDADSDPDDILRSGVQEIANVNGTAYFTVSDNVPGDEQGLSGLWTSDGTPEGTQRILEIPAEDITPAGELLFFANNNELWSSDGTPEGTQVLTEDLNLNSSEFVSIGNILYFSANDGATGFELWKSDGTPEGTELVRNIIPEQNTVGSAPSPSSSNPRNLINVDGTLFFVANDGENGFRLWKSDGTEEGTQSVTNISEGQSPEFLPNDTGTNNFTSVNSILYFIASGNTDLDDGLGRSSLRLWQSDGTAEGTFTIEPEDLNSPEDEVIIESFQVVGIGRDELVEFDDQLFFTGEIYDVEREDYIAALLTPSNSDGNSGDADITGKTVYRFFNTNSGVHFYTANEAERDAVQELSNFNFEGGSYLGVDPLTGQPEPVPVYRFLNQGTGVHLYTTSETEREAVQELDNFSFEGEAFFAYESEVEGSIPIYRFFNATSGAHFYTPSAGERDNVEENLPEFQSEGIAYYALPLPE